MIQEAILHTDGGSRGNPGPSGIGFVLFADDGFELVTLCEGGAFIGETTNNVAEYQALLWGLDNARNFDVEHVSIRSDSELMVKQIKGEYQVKSTGIKPLYQRVMHLLGAFKGFDIEHVFREDNSRADTLANVAMDTRDSIGSFTVPWQEHGQGGIFETVLHFPEAVRHEDIPLDKQGRSPFSYSADYEKSSAPASPRGSYTITIKEHFDAAHALIGYPGECRNMHGHTWDVEVSVSGTELDDVGIVYDFKHLKDNLASILADYDHVCLNDVPPFDSMNATAENLARIIYERLEALLPKQISLQEVSVWESPIAKLTYRR